MTEATYRTLVFMDSVPYRNTTEYVSPTRQKIESFRSFPRGWHYGEGVPLSRRSCDIGLELLDEMLSLGLTRTDAFPGQDGGLMITAYHAGHCLEVMIESDGSQHITHEFDGEDVWTGEGNGKALIRQRAKEILDLVWPSPVWFIQNTMIAHVDASSVWRSGTPPMEAGRPSLTQHAWMRNSA